MSHFKRILVPFDFTAHSSEAMRIASDLAQRYEGSVTLLHVYEPVTYLLPEGYVMYTPEQLASITVEFQKRLDAARIDAEAAGAPVVETYLLEGSPAAEITEHAKEHGYDLIVMGTHGRTGISHVLMGSVAEKVVRTAHCPVLTLRAREKGSDKPSGTSSIFSGV
jgi:nucleotide-binding universal stress UspA family protein